MCENTKKKCVRCGYIAECMGDVVPWEFAIQGGASKWSEWLCDACGRDLVTQLNNAGRNPESQAVLADQKNVNRKAGDAN